MRDRESLSSVNHRFLDLQATTARSLAELVLNLVSVLNVSVDELISEFLSLRRVLANEDGLHTEFVEALQVVHA